VEVAVQVATRWIVTKLRHQRFFSLAELNAAIRDLVAQLNNRVTQHLGKSQRVLFEEIERPALKAVPAPTTTQNGSRTKSALIITSSLTGITTQCRTRYCVRTCGYA
jgi:hypothetical protein